MNTRDAEQPTSRPPPIARPCPGGPVRPLALVVAFLGGLTVGCQTPTPAGAKGALSPEQVANMPLETNIVRVAAYYDPFRPWILSEDRSKVRGIIIGALYLGGRDNRGVFGDGIIRPRVYVLSGDPKKPEPQLVKEWQFDPQAAMLFRAKKQTAMGWGYGNLHLPWGDEVNLSGKEIRVTVSFERRDGAVIHSDKKDFRVP